MKKVSIITISYNSEKTIEQTIQSVINQSYENIEYIIIDGGSKDSTLEIINKYKSNISYLSSEPDKGISDAFNKGIERATGDIIGIINSDDWYEKDAVEQVVKAFDENNEIGFVFGNQNYVSSIGEVLFIQKGDSQYYKLISYDMPSIPHPTVFVMREVYKEKGMFDLSYKTAMDYELLLRFHKNGVKGFYISKILANMRSGGESHVNFLRSFKEVISAAKQYECSKIYLYCYFGIKIIRTFVRRFLQKIGLGEVVGYLRGFLNRKNIIYKKKKF